MKWSDDYLTGIQNIDEHHKMLFRMSEDYRAALGEGRGARVYGVLLESLDHYARAHFGVEEKCMAECQCPAAQQNSQAHGRFVEAIAQFQRRLKAQGFDEADAWRLIEFVDNWLANHIGRIDVQLKQFAGHKTER